MNTHLRWATALCICFSLCNGMGADVKRLELSAGDWDRENSVVAFEVPKESDAAFELRDPNGEPVPIQVDDSGMARFIVGELKRGETATYQLKRLSPGRASLATSTGIQASKRGGIVEVSGRGGPIFEYRAEPGPLPRADIDPIYLRGGYIHPVFSPSRRVVTDHYARNHLHQHGIWFAWTKTEFQGRQPDFWNMGQGKGRVEFVGLDAIWSGPVEGGFRARHQFVDLTGAIPVVALREAWEIRAYQVGRGSRPYWMFDLGSVQECATDDPLILPKYHYGGLGVRGNWNWNGPENTSFLTSEGVTDRVKGNETRGRWCHISGDESGMETGMTILCHPANFRAPQPMRLHPKEPFFCYAPSQAGDWKIEPGKPYVSRYRFIVFDGRPDRGLLDRLWNDYAHPIEVTVVSADE